MDATTDTTIILAPVVDETPGPVESVGDEWTFYAESLPVTEEWTVVQ